MDLTEESRPKKAYNVIEPNTNRVLQMRRIKEERDREQAQMEEKLQKKREEENKLKWTMEKMKEDEKKVQLMRREEEKRRKREEEEESNTLSGRFGHMINDLNTNTTNLEFTTSGMDLRPAQIKVLISNVQNNSSLKGLTMCRKKLTDTEGKQVSEKLGKNQFLQRLQLQGNQLGPQSLVQFAKLLSTNDTIRSIDLEGNKIIRGQEDKPNYNGINELVKALKKNDTILSINLNSTGLDSIASKKLQQMMSCNSTLIMLDVEGNPDMNINDVIAIQDALIKNKQEYDDERYMEFIERKRMRREEDISGVLLLKEQTKKLRSEAIDLNISTKKMQLDQEWKEFLFNEQSKMQKEIIRMEKEATTKKKKKKK